MVKNDYKKVLIDLRNVYIDYKKELNKELITILGLSFLAQQNYLDYITFNMISSDNILKSNVGRFIAYKLFKKRTTKDLLDINIKYCDKFEKASKELYRSDIEYEKICKTLEFIDSINDDELNKYLKYKMN